MTTASPDENAPRSAPQPSPPAPAQQCADRVTCPICAAPGIEKKQKWFCIRCGQLLQTCCD